MTVIGATGFVGRHLVARLRDLGRPVFAPARGDRSVLTTPLGDVVYCAGLTGDARARPLDTVDAHVCHLHELLAAASYDALLYVSSTRVYARSACTDEDSPLTVLPETGEDFFSISKLMGEAACLSVVNPRVRVARISNVFGSAMSPAFLPSIVADACETGTVVLRTALASSKDFVAVEDVVNLLLEISDRGRQRVYNVASGFNVSHAEVTDALKAVTGCTVSVVPNAPIVSPQPIATGRIQTEFGFRPSIRVTDRLSRIVEDYRAANVRTMPVAGPERG